MTTPPPHPATLVEGIVGAGRAVEQPDKLAEFGLGGRLPAVAAWPERPEQVAELLALAGKERWGVVPWGGGTGGGGGARPSRYDLALVLTRLERLLDHDADNLTLTAEAGLRLAEANRRLRPSHQFLPLGFPATGATLGGITAANRPVPKRLLYGETRDMLLGLRVALPGGALVRYGRKVIKNVAGYDMNKLFLGSHGMLGVIVETTFKLFALPDEEGWLVGSFGEAAAAAGAAGELLASPLLPSCLLLADPGAAAALGRLSLPVAGSPGAATGAAPGALLLAGFEGRGVALRRQLEQGGALMKSHGAAASEYVAELPEAVTLYLCRPGSVKHGGEQARLRVGVLPTQTAGMLTRLARRAGELGLDCQSVADYATGAILTTLSGSLRDCADELIEWIGRLRAELEPGRGWCELLDGPEELKNRLSPWGGLGGEVEIMRLLRDSMDPHGILSPERFL